MAVFGTTNIKASEVQAELGASAAELSALCTHENLNQWAKYKPANYGVGNNSQSGVPPIGEATALTGFRLGDFRKYDQDALPPLYFHPDPVSAAILADMTANEGLSGTTLQVNINAPITGMRPTANNNGFDPDDLFLKSQDGTIRIRARIYDGENYVGDGSWIELIDPGWDEAVVILSTSDIAVSGLATGEYALHGQKQYYYANQWQDIGNRFEGGDAVLNFFNGTKFSIDATLDLNGVMDYTITRNYGSGNVNITIEYYEGLTLIDTLILSNVSPGNYEYDPVARPSGENVRYVITNTDSTYEYVNIQGFVPA